MSNENKKPMTKAKKEFIAAIIWLAAGVIFAITGGILISMPKQQWELIFGIVIVCCGVAIIGLGTYLLIKNYKKMKTEKSA